MNPNKPIPRRMTEQDIKARFGFDVHDYVLSQEEMDEMIKTPEGIMQLLKYVQKKAKNLNQILATINADPKNIGRLKDKIKNAKVIRREGD